MRKLSVAIIIALLAVITAMVAGCTSGNTPTKTSSQSPAAKTGTPAKLAFITQPGGGAAGSVLSTQPVVAIQDSDGNTVTSSVLPVKLTITSGSGGSGSALLGRSTVNAINGVATFRDLFIIKAGTGYTVTAACGNLTPATSTSFAISPGAAAKLVFTIQPSGGVAGSPFATQPEVIVQDNYGNTVTGYEGSVTMGITYGSGSASATLSGKTTIGIVNSTARFTDLSIDKSYPDNYTLTASSGSLASATSQGFIISVGAPAKLEFTVQTAGAKAGKPFETQPKVAIEDNWGMWSIAPELP